MNLTINFVWIGKGALKQLEKFMIYSWLLCGCEVNLFTHYPEEGKMHNFSSLDLKEFERCNIIDLPTFVGRGKTVANKLFMPLTSGMLMSWFGTKMLPWGSGGQEFTFNMIDLCKSYIAATTRGIVMDMKIGPSPHIQTYVDKGVFSNEFIGMKRVGTIENQLMGSMSESDTRRNIYGTAFESALFLLDKNAQQLTNKRIEDMRKDITSKWFGMATAAHNRAMTGLGLKGDWVDLSLKAKDKHKDKFQIEGASFIGIFGDDNKNEDGYGPVRVFKRESDQTNKIGNRTTEKAKNDLQHIAYEELKHFGTDSIKLLTLLEENYVPVPIQKTD